MNTRRPDWNPGSVDRRLNASVLSPSCEVGRVGADFLCKSLRIIQHQPSRCTILQEMVSPSVIAIGVRTHVRGSITLIIRIRVDVKNIRAVGAIAATVPKNHRCVELYERL